MSGTRNLDELKKQVLTCIDAIYDKGYEAGKQAVFSEIFEKMREYDERKQQENL